MSGLWGKADDKTSTGTLTVAANGLVTGVGTDFVTEAAVGDFITTDAETLLITSITNTTVCHVQAQTLGGSIATASANQFTLSEKPQYVASVEVGANAAQVFGVDTTEIGIAGGLISGTITSPGSGYFANAAVTVGGDGSSGTANAEANSTGRIATINITAAGSGYSTATFTIAAPAAQSTNAGAVAANGFIPITANKFQVNDYVTYDVAAGNTAITELTDGSQYYIQAANTTGVYLASTLGGSALTLTAGSNETGHTLTGETATAVPVLSGGTAAGVAHAGWIRRTVGTGTKAGRVSTEVLVASRLTSDAADDTEFPDS